MKPWSRIHLDFLGPIQDRIFLVVVDAHTKWLEVKEVPSTAAIHTINFLKHLFSIFGLCEHVVTDNGPPFTSKEVANFFQNLGIKLTHSPPYHPQTNGLAEVQVKLIKNCIRKAIIEKRKINEAITQLLFDYRNSIHSTTGEKPSQLMFNRSLRVKWDLTLPKVVKAQQAQVRHAGGVTTRELQIGEKVLARNYSKEGRWSSGTVQKRLGPVTYLISLDNGIYWKRHINQLISAENVREEKNPDNFEVPIQEKEPDNVKISDIVVPIIDTEKNVTVAENVQPAGSPQPSAKVASPVNVPASPVKLRRNPPRERRPPVKLNL